MLIINVHISVSVSGQKDTNLEISCCMGLHAGMLINFSLIFSILERKNSANLLLVSHLFCSVAWGFVLYCQLVY